MVTPSRRAQATCEAASSSWEASKVPCRRADSAKSATMASRWEASSCFRRCFSVAKAVDDLAVQSQGAGIIDDEFEDGLELAAAWGVVHERDHAGQTGLDHPMDGGRGAHVRDFVTSLNKVAHQEVGSALTIAPAIASPSS